MSAGFPISDLEVSNFQLSNSLDAPIIDESKDISKSASDKGFTGKLICRATGAPNITFQWFRQGEAIPGGPEDSPRTKHVIRSEMEDRLTWRSELLVHRVDSGDYGNYSCAASNIMGVSRHQVMIMVMVMVMETMMMMMMMDT